MRTLKLSVSLFVLLLFFNGRANAEGWSGELEAATRYVDDEPFNAPFGDAPVLKVTGTYSSLYGFYAEGYVYTGFEDPLRDESSEYGFEVGKNFGPLIGAFGRYMNYGGQGADVGDWYLYAGAGYKNFYASATYLWGNEDDAIIYAEYSLTPGSVRIVPSAAYYVRQEKLNPSVAAAFPLREGLELRFNAVYGEDSEGEREPAFSLGLAFSF